MDEYKGEKVIEKLKARLVPPNSNYPDCMCEILLTGQHLYVLEDNFDGTYETHFAFPVRQIIKMETEEIAKLSGKPEEEDKAVSIAASLMGLLGGRAAAGGRWKEKKTSAYFTITCHNGMGETERIYFTELQYSSKALRKAFAAVKSAMN